MTNNELSKAERAFVAGFTAARVRGNTNADIGPVSERTARSLFREWNESND